MRLLLARVFTLSVQEKIRALEAAVTLFGVRLVFGLLPFPRALRLLRIVQGQSSCGRLAAHEAVDIARAISRSARYVPFRAVCLQQAFAALLMLRRRGLAATVHLGAARDTDANALTAHAWCHSGTVPVTGEAVTREFVSVAAFGA